MPNILNEPTCPRCGRESYYEEYSGMGTFYAFCPFCGRVTTNEPDMENYPGSGIMCIATKEVINLDAFDPPKSQEELEVLKRTFMEEIEKPTVDKENSYLTLWNEEKGGLEVLFGTVPEPTKELFPDSPKGAVVLDCNQEDDDCLPF